MKRREFISRSVGVSLTSAVCRGSFLIQGTIDSPVGVRENSKPLSSEAKLFFKGEFKGSPQTQSLLWTAICSQDEAKVLGEQAARLRPGAKSGADAANEILKAYQEQVAKSDLARKVLTINIEIIAGAIKIGSAVGTGGNSLIVGVASQVLDWGLQETLKLYDVKAEEVALTILGDGLKKAEKNGVNLKELRGLKPSDAFERIYGDQPVFGIPLEKLKKEHQDFIIGKMYGAIQKTVVAGTTAGLKMQEMNAKELKKTQDGLRKLTGHLSQFATETRSRFDGIRLVQEGMQKDIQQIKDNAISQDKKLSLIQAYMFKDMTVSDKIAALEAGWLEMPQSQRKQELEGLKYEERRQLAAQQLQKYFSDATNLIQLGRRLGVDGPLIQVAEKFVPVADSLVNKIGPALINGNYIQAALAVSSLFGGGADPETERHNQVMGAIGKVQEQLGRISEQLKEVLELQKYTVELVVDLSKSVARMHQQMVENHKTLSDKLDSLSADIGFLTGLVADLAGIATPSNFLATRQNYEGFNGSTFNSYRSLEKHFNHQPPGTYAKAWDVVSTVFAIGGDVNRVFSQKMMEALANEKKVTGSQGVLVNKATDVRIKMYDPAVEVITSCLPLVQDKYKEDTFWSCFFVPVFSCSALKSLDKSLAESKVESVTKSDLKLPIRSYLENLLAPSIVSTLGKYLLDLFPYTEMVAKDNHSLLSPREILEKWKSGHINTEILDNGRVIVSMSLLQQTILGGHMMLPLLDAVSKLPNPDKSDKNDKVNEVLNKFSGDGGLLESNRFLRRNWMIYQLNKKFDGNVDWLIKYAYKVRLRQDSRPIAEMLPNEWAPRLILGENKTGEKIWHIKFGENGMQALPTPEEIETGYLKYPAEEQELRDLKYNLVDLLACYNLKLGSDNRKLMSHFTPRMIGRPM